MTGTKIELDFGHIYFRTEEEARHFATRVQKVVSINVEDMIETGTLRYREDPEDQPTRLKVAVEVRQEVV